MITDADRFSKLLGGFQSAVVSVAVVIGGAWTLYAFNSQLQVENAKAQLAKLKREIEAVPKLEIVIDLHQLQGTPGLVVGTLVVRNVGTEDTALVLSDTPVELFEVAFDADGIEQWKSVRKFPLRLSDEVVYGAIAMHASLQVSRSFMVSTPKPGLFAVKFSADRNKDEVARLSKMGIPGTDIATRAEWGSHSYILVQ